MIAVSYMVNGFADSGVEQNFQYKQAPFSVKTDCVKSELSL